METQGHGQVWQGLEFRDGRFNRKCIQFVASVGCPKPRCPLGS